MKTTASVVTVELWCVVECPNCGAMLRLAATLPENSLTTGNTTQTAAYHAEMLREQMLTVQKARLWNGEMCGRCRISLGESKTRLPSEEIIVLAHPQGVEP